MGDTDVRHTRTHPASFRPFTCMCQQLTRPLSPQIMLPKARIKRVMKADEDVKNIKPEAVIMVAKATELFVELLTEQAYRHAVADKRKGLSYKVSRARHRPSASSLPRLAQPARRCVHG